MRTLTIMLSSAVAAWFLPFIFEATRAHATEPKPETVAIGHTVEVNCATKNKAAKASAVALPPQGIFFTDSSGYISCHAKNQLVFEAHYMCAGGKFVIPHDVPYGIGRLECTNDS